MMISRIGELIGEKIIDRTKKFENLEEALEHLYWWEKEYSIEKTEDSIISRGVCPIYEKYPDWCENGCVGFAEDIADEYEYSVNRTKRRPNDEVCEFKFRKNL
ncbi:hypothetical protein AKJ65_08330 [candidate division MSBL1 archaeon SCGC-AAA259E19]|uniref:L-2-amino-thiazoline-4-carboxylic acid hydrolase n=1 Tax=candidate division MSBL1 archaeon SCGC-AAA259E19 TaxID=1698264 RepID=A0A133UCE7_9EURY|nr:hypothetical protein AKJ65_08330 [candidate division MSBL1 archaeon SCGC-AAA259E19]